MVENSDGCNSGHDGGSEERPCHVFGGDDSCVDGGDDGGESGCIYGGGGSGGQRLW